MQTIERKKNTLIAERYENIKNVLDDTGKRVEATFADIADDIDVFEGKFNWVIILKRMKT